MAEAVPNNTTTLEINTNDGVVNMNNQILFTVAAPMSLHQRHILYDARRVPLYTLYKKKFSMHDRWKVYNGESTNSPDFSFSVMRKSMIQWGIVELKVFLANNRDEKVCDYVIYAGFLRRSCTIVSVHSSTVVAKMRKIGGKYVVTVYPNFINYAAFITTLIIILDKMSYIDSVSRTTLKIARMMMDPFDISGFFLDQFGETITEAIMDLIVEQIMENNNNGTN